MSSQHRPPFPKGTGHKARQRPSKLPTQKAKSTRTPLRPEELKEIAAQCRAKWGWEATLKEGQVNAIKAQLQGLDVVVHAPTGYGKTCIAAGPHAHPKAQGLVTIMVSPLIALQEEMVDTLREEFKMKAIAVNSSHGGCTSEAMESIVRGDYQVILISPELLLSSRFLDQVMRDTSFTRKILSVVIDEAHVVSHWGSGFRKQYGSLGIIRAFLPRHVSVVAMSATLSGRVRNDVLSKLQFGKTYVDVDVGNDRPNVTLVVRAIHHPMNSYRDLDFVIPSTTMRAEDIPLTWVYADDISAGIKIEDHLTDLLPTPLKTLGLIRPYNAAFSKEYRAEAMRLVRDGQIRVLICTDAAGMGCNIPNIDVVVQWKLPSSLSSFVQRAGRAARKMGRQGLGVLLAEPSAYEHDLFVQTDESVKAGKKGGKKKKEERTKAQRKVYAESRGLLRGSRSRQDTCTTRDQPPIDRNADDEGLLVLVQTTGCRRAVLKDVYKNKNPIDCTGPCCDICDASLLDRTRPGVFKPPARRSALTRGVPSLMVQLKLDEWRTRVKKRDFPLATWSCDAILQQQTMSLLASVGPIHDRGTLDSVLSGQWTWLEKYGDELLTFLKSFEMPAFVAKPKPVPKRKRAGPDGGQDAGAGEVRDSAAGGKRARMGTGGAVNSADDGRQAYVTNQLPLPLPTTPSQPSRHPTTPFVLSRPPAYPLPTPQQPGLPPWTGYVMSPGYSALPMTPISVDRAHVSYPPRGSYGHDLYPRQHALASSPFPPPPTPSQSSSSSTPTPAPIPGSQYSQLTWMPLGATSGRRSKTRQP